MQSHPTNPFAPPSSDVLTHGSRPNEHLRIAYKITRWDYLRWTLYHQFGTVANQAIMLLGSGLISFTDDQTKHPWAVFIVLYVALWLLQALLVVVVVASGKNRRLFTDHETTLTPSGMLVQTRFSSCVYYWSGIDRVRICPGLVAVYMNTHGAQLIPKRAFSAPSHLEQFLSVLGARRRDA